MVIYIFGCFVLLLLLLFVRCINIKNGFEISQMDLRVNNKFENNHQKIILRSFKKKTWSLI